MILSVDDLYNLYYGGSAVADNRKYLRRAYNEDDAEYDKRLKWSSYVNYPKKIINTYLSYIFYEKVIVDPPEPLDLEDIAKRLCLHSLICGEAYLFEAGEQIHVLSKRDVSCEKGNRYTIKAANGKFVIDLEALMITGPDAAGVEVTESLVPGRFVICRWNEDGVSLIEDAAMMALELYNMGSQLKMHFDRSLFYLLYGPPLGEQKPIPGQYVPVNSGEIQPGIVQVDSSHAERMRKEMQIIKHEMAISVSLEQEFADEIKIESGAALTVRKMDINAIISSIAFYLTKAINECAAHYSRQYKTPLQTIMLEPLLKIQTPQEEYAKYKFLLEFAGTDLVCKQVQKQVVQHGLGTEIDKQDMDLLLESIEKEGGAKLFQSQGFLSFS